MKPIENTVEKLICPIADTCDHNFGRGIPCTHYIPHVRQGECGCVNCGDHVDVPCIVYDGGKK